MALDKFQPYLFVSAGEQSNKYLTPVITNGIAQFQAQRVQDLTGLKVRIDPIQEGSGDPAPTNIRPISGRTGMTVTRAGKNLLNPALTSGLLSITVGALETDITPSGRYAYTERFPSTEDVILSIKSSEVARCEYAKIVQYVDGVVVAVATNVNMGDTTTWHTKVMPGCPNSYCRIVIGGTNLSPGEYIHGDAQVEVGSTATAYEPYAGQTYPVSWQTEAGTIYGGTLDVVSGVLTVEYGKYTIPSDIALTDRIDSQNRVYWNFTDMMPGAYLTDGQTVCNRLPKSAPTNEPTAPCICIGAASNASYVYLQGVKLLDGVTNLATLRTWLEANPVEFTYKLATPQTYNITPEDIKTLAGFNQIYSDAGPVIDIKF